jgi:hypothetical protein
VGKFGNLPSFAKIFCRVAAVLARGKSSYSWIKLFKGKSSAGFKFFPQIWYNMGGVRKTYAAA